MRVPPDHNGSLDRSPRQRWESWTTWPLIAASAVFLVVYSWVVLEPSMPDALHGLLIAILLVLWASFIIDFVARLALTRRHERRSFVREYRIDLLSAFIPIVRPFGLLKYLRVLPGFRGETGRSLRSRIIVYVAAYEALYIYVLALSVLATARNAPNATIVNFGDALWWAFVTVATVGYGDFYPVTSLGRFLAVLLMAGGVAIIGTASATIVSIISERVQKNVPPPDSNDKPGSSTR